MDFLQTCYKRPCRFYHDQVVDTTIEWYWAAPGALQLALPTVFHSMRAIGDRGPFGDVGEVVGSRVRFTKGLTPHPGLDGTHLEGTAADFLGDGIPPESVLVPGGKTPDNVPCLISPALGLGVDLPQFWQVESAPLGLIGRTDGTYYSIEVDWELGGCGHVDAVFTMPAGLDLGGPGFRTGSIDGGGGLELGGPGFVTSALEVGPGWEVGGPGHVVEPIPVMPLWELAGPGAIPIDVGPGWELGGPGMITLSIGTGGGLELGGPGVVTAAIDFPGGLELGGPGEVTTSIDVAPDWELGGPGEV